MDSLPNQEVGTERDKGTAVSIFRQILVASSVCTQFFMGGMCAGAPTVFIPQIKKEANSTVVIDDELGSWLYSTSGFAMYPWIIILPLVTKRWGRKLPQMITAVCSVVIYTILYFSKSPYHILISEIFQGFLYGGNVTIRILTVIEYSSPKYRGLFLAIKSASFFWGIWVANAIGTFFYWKNIAILGFVCAIFTFNVVFWPESPYWLASKGRFDECRASYRWIYGRNETSEKKLNDLIASYNNRNEYDDVGVLKILRNKEFYRPISICVLMVIQYHFSGKIVCCLYILDIFKNITKEEKTAYAAMLILDGVTVFGMYFGSFLSKIFKRRTLYMTSSFVGVFLLLIISTYLYLVRFNYIKGNDYITIAILIIYSLSISCGPLILCLSIYGEVIPTKYQASCYVITGFTFAIFYSWSIKLTPFAFASIGIHGTFMLFFITCGLCTIYLYLYMPETKNKTFHEIELLFKDKVTGGLVYFLPKESALPFNGEMQIAFLPPLPVDMINTVTIIIICNQS